MEREHRTPIKDWLCRQTEKPVLEGLYVEFSVATDQLRRCPDVLRTIVGTFNRLTGRDLDAATLLRYMVNRRKQNDWPRLGRRARKFESPVDAFSDVELAALRGIYLELDQTSDDLQFNAGYLRVLSRRFREQTGRTVPGSVLVAVILAKRKRGEWPRIRQEFADLEQAATL